MFCGHVARVFYSIVIGVVVVRGSDQFLYSKGVTQGDPLPMFMYTIISVPLISSLVDEAGVMLVLCKQAVPIYISDTL